MKQLRWLLMTMILVAGCTALASAQGYPDRDRDDYRGWRADGDRDDHYRGSQGLYFARKFGYEDGFNDGLYDRRTGHSFRPTHSGNFKHADRGFNPRFASRYAYRDEYRENYEAGYRRGYWR